MDGDDTPRQNCVFAISITVDPVNPKLGDGSIVLPDGSCHPATVPTHSHPAGEGGWSPSKDNHVTPPGYSPVSVETLDAVSESGSNGSSEALPPEDVGQSEDGVCQENSDAMVTDPSHPKPDPNPTPFTEAYQCPYQYQPPDADREPSLPPPPIFTVEVQHELPVLGGFLVTEKDEKDRSSSVILEMKALQKEDANQNQCPPTERCDSTLSTISDKLDICRICHCEAEENNKLISPCLCAGSLKYLHLACLQRWIKSSDKIACELCNFDYIMSTKTRAFKEVFQWEKLEVTPNERRKIICSVTFHIIAIVCVIWSLYVLIDRTTEEVHSGNLDWPFWTKLIVVVIGFTGGVIFMYVQCKMYSRLCLRWRTFNRVISVENAPEDPQLRADAAAKIKAKSEERGGEVNTVALQEVDSI